jgi:hypothetical protein
MSKALIVVGILSGTILSHAGVKHSFPVQINTGLTGSAHGSVADARASTSDFEALACSQEASGGARYGSCTALSAKNEIAFCWTTDPAALATLSTLQGDSFLFFEWDSRGNCTRVEVGNGSHFRPKTL